MSKELSHIPAPEAKVLNQNDLVIQRSTMDTRERHDYDIKEKEIREYIMDLETRYDLKKFLELENYTVLDIKDKINFISQIVYIALFKNKFFGQNSFKTVITNQNKTLASHRFQNCFIK